MKKHRAEDTNLNFGIAQEKGYLDFYLMSPPTMSTFSREESEKLQKETTITLSNIIKTETDSLPNIISQYAHGVFPDFLSLDVEGLEEVVLKCVDYKNNFPKVICIETLSYTENNTEIKDKHLIDLLIGEGYLLFADTYINSIFVKHDLWKNR